MSSDLTIFDPQNKASLSWRALRLIVSSNLAAFEQTPKGDLPTLHSVITGTKAAKTEKDLAVQAVEAVETAEPENGAEAVDVDMKPEASIEVEANMQVDDSGDVIEQSA